jgi:two-component system CheB/CheR fusion protein
MQVSAKRMKTLVQDLLDYSRTNSTERHFENTDLNAIVEEVKAELEEMIAEKKAVIETDHLDEVYVNSSLFRQVLNNLIANAIKFSKPGVPPHIIIKTKIAELDQLQNENPDLNSDRLSSKKYCHISVADNGIGFDRQFKDKIFDVFQRLQTQEIHVGTGIGLAIVKKIIEHHNGVITAKSEVNKGACFDIYIPTE